MLNATRHKEYFITVVIKTTLLNSLIYVSIWSFSVIIYNSGKT